MIQNIPDNKQIANIERKLDKWLKGILNKDNVYQAIYDVLDMSAPHINKTWPDGYCGMPGSWQRKDDDSEIGNLIAAIKDPETQMRLWSKYNKLVKKMSKFPDTFLILIHSGCLDLLLEATEKKIKKLKPGEDLILAYTWDIIPMLRSYLRHKEKIPLLKDAKKTQKVIEHLIKTVLILAKGCKDFKDWYFNSQCLAEFYLFHDLKIPKGLHGLAQYMLKEDKKKLRWEKENFEKKTRELKAHISKIEKSL